ncbi:CBS domain-containing protein [Methylobacterium nodulans]|uniref:Putative signal transduction protein with CBS domains n=1 Tax=Methylobacterium nodulans (strain LMG 21967 / CNCM I-2342 / ORS 2060) TaxID=460265 RepID=B8IUN2_METNO|nr:CBS domain-containing protein [Methylobacterium nodulans]ACL57100.1 putative signal transduction protein with CBS domains [Methylobacterium nodulans ORS 2060]
MPDRSVTEFLAGRPLRSVTGNFTVARVCLRLREYGVGALVVLEERRLVGIISERDVATRVIAGHRDPMLTLVREVMTRDPETIAAEASLAEAYRRMLTGGFRHLPVMRGQEVIGMISLCDIPVRGDISMRGDMAPLSHEALDPVLALG